MEIWKKAYRYKLHHFVIWTIIFLIWFYFREKDFPSKAMAINVTALKVIMLAGMVYVSIYLLVPKFLYRKRYFLFFVFYTILIVLTGMLKLSIVMHMVYPGVNPFSDFKARFYDNIIPHFLLVSTAVAFRLIRDYFLAQKTLTEVAKEKAETELKFLRSQINPHFLFNTLNSIYFLIDKNNHEARQTMLRFSDLLRYQLYECNADLIDIKKEAAYLQDYIRLQQIRRDNNYQVSIEGFDELQGFRIVPLLLIPFVENAFKHISHYPQKPNFIHISMSVKDDTFYFTVENSRHASDASTEPVGGIGLRNVKRRLELLYPGKHSLQITDIDSIFKVSLTLIVGPPQKQIKKTPVHDTQLYYHR